VRGGLVKQSNVLVLIAAWNEEEGIGPTLEELKNVLGDASFLIVDGNSTDKTVEIAKDAGAEILIQEGKGKGKAIAQAVKHINENFDYVILTDGDFTYPAGYIPKMLKILNDHPNIGMVCGDRFTGSLDLGEQHNLLYFGNRFLAFTHNMLNGVELKDPLTGLRVLRADVLRNWKPKSKSFDIEVELNHQVERRGYAIKEIPITYRPRLGEKKLRLRHGLTIMKRILSEAIPHPYHT
jgi:glycosyltransferase involved in cell wall biosynthesis